ncbi:MAG TPA: lipid-A-disaccharide synthase [Burkholderiales bacterium]|nr:lipid-A-disaccharide synthase [Burkholderiales bacterium]
MSEPSRRTTRIAFVAGEASGDLLGAKLLQALSERVPRLQAFGIGGPKMQSAGLEVWYPMELLAVRGYVEVLRSLPKLLRIRRELRKRLLADPPDLFIGIDAPDFNLDLELALRSRGITTVHYASPSIWAWRGERIHKIKRAVSKMLTLFPFEAEIYEKAGVPVAYVGHPLADDLPEYPDKDAAREQMRLSPEQTVVALLPGSRQSEVRQMGELFAATAKLVAEQFPDVHFLVPLVSRETRIIFEEALYHQNAEHLPLTILFAHAHMAMIAADAVLVASGTATLEAALLKRSMVITYKMPRLSAWIMRRRGRLRFVGLPNILADAFTVPEILLEDATPENLAQALANQLEDKEVRRRLEHRFLEIHRMLKQGSAARAVEAILPLLGAIKLPTRVASAAAREGAQA